MEREPSSPGQSLLPLLEPLDRLLDHVGGEVVLPYADPEALLETPPDGGKPAVKPSRERDQSAELEASVLARRGAS